MKYSLLIIALFSGKLLAIEGPDSLFEPIFSGYLQSKNIIHNPEKIMFQGRNYNLELVVDLPDSIIKSVSLLVRTKMRSPYQEVFLQRERGLYSFHFDSEIFSGSLIQYFFVVQLSDYSLFAVPINEKGDIQPVKRLFIDPIEYYK